jgi:hypothetical protein
MPNSSRKTTAPRMTRTIAIKGETKNEMATAMRSIRAKIMGVGTQGRSI